MAAPAQAGVGIADHYGVLECAKEADDTTIKKNYRRLVLKWHPDKQPEAGREAAEDKIRQINDAYETLGNPFKRGQYDQQLLALERMARGYRLDTSSIKPRMSIPKEFMLSPMGHPEKFVRVCGMSIFVQSRSDKKGTFDDFFRDAKFSLWWLPEVNNMCRLRPTTTAAVGQDGGLNFNWALHRTVKESEVILNPNATPENANLIAVASPVFAKAFRFEASQFPGHYLAFKPPTHMRMVGGTVDMTTAIDFLLVDFQQAFNYQSLEEVLTPTAIRLGARQDFVSLHKIKKEREITEYFSNVLKQSVWSDDDFETFFVSRSSDWAFEAHDRDPRVRLRTKHEVLANNLRKSRNIPELAAAISGAETSDVLRLPLDTLESMLNALEPPLQADFDLSTVINISDAQRKILEALPRAADKDAAFKKMLTLYDRVIAFGGNHADVKIAKWRSEAAEGLGRVVADQIRRYGHKEDLVTSLEVLEHVCKMPLDWKSCGDRLAKISAELFEKQSVEALMPILRATVKALPGSQTLSEKLADKMHRQLKKAATGLAADAMDLMVSGGLCIDVIPASLERVMRDAPFATVVSVVAGLGEREAKGSDFKDVCKYVGKRQQLLEEQPPATLLRLMVAFTKSSVLTDGALDAVAGASAMTLPGWSMEDASKLLLAIAKAKGGATGDGVDNLYRRASEVMVGKLSELSSVQLIKVVLAVGKPKLCRPLLYAALSELVQNRLTDLPANQLLLLTQGLVPLEDIDEQLGWLIDYWTTSFQETTRVEGLLGPEMVPSKRQDTEAKGGITADMLAKLVQALADKAKEREAFWIAVARRYIDHGDIEGIASSLTEPGRKCIEAAFPSGGGPIFPGKQAMLTACYDRRTPEQKERDKEKERDRKAAEERDRKRKLREAEEEEIERKIREKRRKKEEEESSGSKRKRKKEKDKDKKKKKEEEKKPKEQEEEIAVVRQRKPAKDLFEAAAMNSLEECKTMLANGANVNQASGSGVTALHLASAKGTTRICLALLEAKAAVNSAKADGNTALHLAVCSGSLDAVRTLLERSALVNSQTGDGLTPLHMATSAGLTTVIALLVSSKASASIKDKKGRTPLEMYQQATDTVEEINEIKDDDTKSSATPAAVATKETKKKAAKVVELALDDDDAASPDVDDDDVQPVNGSEKPAADEEKRRQQRERRQKAKEEREKANADAKRKQAQIEEEKRKKREEARSKAKTGVVSLDLDD
eukprot:TRINITY_DN3742_c0_g1_i1.p1 TRINITY_DN3742_c0_g1~~TRINITY_DN3742_c0_g1_i1.p1  ORF type:complete len:1227 (+),score=309.43 TRINITY_DN3742_c0_g1_i1:134-3814(+)